MPKFKNYKNNHTKNGIIYSNVDLYKMPFGEAVKRKKEISGQYRQIGVPTVKELKNSSNVVYVHEYTRADGTHVKAHWRSKPEGSSILPETDPDKEIVYDFEEGTYYPTTEPTKAPSGDPADIPGGDGDGGSVWEIIWEILKEVFGIIFEYMTSSSFSGLSNIVDNSSLELLVDGSNSNGGVALSPMSIDTSSPTPFRVENIDNSKHIKEFLESMAGFGGSMDVNSISSGAGDKVISSGNLPVSRFGFANVDNVAPAEQKKGVSFDSSGKSGSQPINQPMAHHSESDIENYINMLVNNSQKNNKSEFGNMFMSFINEFLKGGFQGINSLGTGLGKQYANVIREVMGKESLSQEEIDNIYAKIQGRPSKSIAYKSGDFVGEIVPFLMLPEIKVASFPAIVNLLLTNMYQSAVDSAKDSVIEHGVSPHIITDTIKGTAQGILNTILLQGLFKGVDSSTLLKKLEERLQKLINELAEDFATPVLQKNGSVVYKRYNGDTVTNEDVALHIIENWRKKQQSKIKERELVKKHLQKNLKEFKINGVKYKQIWMPEDEYASVSHEFTTYIMQNNYSEPILMRNYRGCIYVAVLEDIDGQLMPVFVKKVKIKGVK